ncbi:ABC transporter ATP-binding protein [Lachnobacterium bovis]|uniref:ATP-binding cassette, subfamily B n=1 Tax=Lachnobacterium bovis DSM 14045 TaxID=1122142 RepID=A0A1H3FJI8_9FIRM|nr:ABC transporter ATP-binding protein [Lachnobacterium bovis]SDX91090.1 ATP-binding cassette, subfamily B [Lachnobacterium bovis DSM 14045]
MIKIFKKFTKKEILFIIISLFFIILQVGLDLKLPDYMADITKLLETKNGGHVREIIENGVYMLLCAFGSMLASCLVGFLAAKVAAGLAKRLRGLVYEKTMTFTMEEINTFSTDSLITRTTNDITQIQTLIAMGLQVVIKAPILATWAILKILNKNWQWSFATGVAVCVLMMYLIIMIALVLPKFRKLQTLTDNLNKVTRENLSGIRVVRAYNAEKYQEEKFDVANTNVMRTNLFTGRSMASVFPMMSLLISSLPLVIYWIGMYIIKNAKDIGEKFQLFSDMVVFSSYAIQVIMAFMMLIVVFFIFPRANISAKRINEVLETNTKIFDGAVTENNQKSEGEIEFRNVGFKYPYSNEYAIKDISFTAKKGETVAFIGATGSGKSTLINLIPRFYDVTEGQILIDGVNVKEYSKDILRKKLGYVPQKAVLFKGSIFSNIMFGDNSDNISNDKAESIVKEAIEISQSKEFVEKMKKGFRSVISQGGTNVSGGQKQRISIARAIARKPEILLFDDSFSALDYKTDRILREQLKMQKKETTSLIVAQRIGTIKDADKIVVLDEGKLVGYGTHKELLKNCAVYYEIASSQLSEDEIKKDM